ncbi:class I SAM-dependent methyltransferase [Bacillus sp. ISL-47]|uniref:class I SAM-dependent methyltransferase n=1 Tax=Bacillus sp. ISL-47 TaxID=2819130 RepID=UPI001BE5B253|nr:class I SAM-dependent methyltransferase [Bacillus sp. ISL-47]MBT2690582.1 class I SAM-dependent methyltransferase [Bacillus sp. ISL-47]MBT2708162.1 class I SAM-dependent methyltransferase [Pseudomonas sp. ISL-84]
MNKSWNKFIYKLGSVVYDKFFNSGKFLKARKQIFREGIFEGEHQSILFVGVGTGADLELIDTNKFDITAIDYSYAMLNKARAKFKSTSIKFLNMDAQEMAFPANHFDLVVASLILSVVPDEDKCMKEIVRVLKPNGKILIFDKFSPKGKKLPIFKKFLRPFIQVLGTDIGRDFERLYENHNENLSIKENSPILFNGMYRKIVLFKT